MTLFPEDKPTVEHAKWSEQLSRSLKNIKIVSNRVSSRAWPKEFAWLERKYSADQVKKVLDWYCEHAGDIFVPVVRSGHAFRAKFLQITQAMERSLIEDIPVTPDNRRLAERLANDLGLPIEIKAALPRLVQATHENWLRFVDQLLSAEQYKAGEEPRLPSRSRTFILFTLSASGNFLEEWFRVICSGYQHLDHFTGNLTTLVFSVDNTKFLRYFWQNWSNQWCGEPDAFDWLLKKLEKGEIQD